MCIHMSHVQLPYTVINVQVNMQGGGEGTEPNIGKLGNFGNLQIAIKVAGSIGSHIGSLYGSHLELLKWLPIKIGNLMIQPYFEVFYALLVGGKLQNFEDPSLVILGYQLLPLATSKLMGDNREFNDSPIF